MTFTGIFRPLPVPRLPSEDQRQTGCSFILNTSAGNQAVVLRRASQAASRPGLHCSQQLAGGLAGWRAGRRGEACHPGGDRAGAGAGAAGGCGWSQAQHAPRRRGCSCACRRTSTWPTPARSPPPTCKSLPGGGQASSSARDEPNVVSDAGERRRESTAPRAGEVATGTGRKPGQRRTTDGSVIPGNQHDRELDA